MNLVMTEAPTVEPVNLLDVKEYLRLDDDEDDLFILSLITLARQFCETFQNRAYLTQTWEMSFDYWPRGVVTIPKGNLQEIISIKYTNSDGIETVLPTTEYVSTTRGMLGRLTVPYGKTWPSFVPFPLDAVVIEFKAGYGDDETTIPENVKVAMYLLISHWYDNRALLVGDKNKINDEIKFAVSALLWQERIILL